LATFERAWYKPIHTGIVAKVGKHPGAIISEGKKKKAETSKYIGSS